jgi:hypothetical protein
LWQSHTAPTVRFRRKQSSLLSDIGNEKSPLGDVSFEPMSGIEGQVSKLAHSLRTSSPVSLVAKPHSSDCSFPTKAKQFAF